ncbi:hypothetical protein CMALT394_310121 [Carnobacterium maltaromaticum]|nr:hypothetical protein CMALT394_310121 [Carnobacterium maltaromaticum]
MSSNSHHYLILCLFAHFITIWQISFSDFHQFVAKSTLFDLRLVLYVICY